MQIVIALITVMDNSDEIFGLSRGGIGITEKAIMKTGVMMVGADVHGYLTTAAFLDTLAAILF